MFTLDGDVVAHIAPVKDLALLQGSVLHFVRLFIRNGVGCVLSSIG